MDPNGGSSSPEDIFNSTVNKMVAASVASGVALIVAVAAIIYAIINCVKKAGSTIPISARVVSSVDSTGKDSNQVAIDVRADQFPVKVDFPTTIKGFLSNMAREKPIAFSHKQIEEFTNNYNPANLLGSGAFGVVYKGLLVDGVEVAVKVLTNNNSAKIVEEQFMAEVGTLGTTVDFGNIMEIANPLVLGLRVDEQGHRIGQVVHLGWFCLLFSIK